LLFLGSERCKF